LQQKLAKEMYKKHENDAQNMQVWVAENKDQIFFYQENGGQVEGNL